MVTPLERSPPHDQFWSSNRSADQPQAANSGHPGAPMGMAPMAHLLWTEFLKFNPSNPRWVRAPLCTTLLMRNINPILCAREYYWHML
jgi:hypothetical protein